IIDEDPIGMLRPMVAITRDDLNKYLDIMKAIVAYFHKQADVSSEVVAKHYHKIASWLWETINQQEPGAEFQAVDIPPELVRISSSLPKKALTQGKKALDGVFRTLMRRDPHETVRNVTRDLTDLKRAAGKVVFATSDRVIFHVQVRIPHGKRVFILDATAN